MRTIFTNGIVYTGETDFAHAFFVVDGVFRAVGANEEMLAFSGPGTDVVDLGGRFVCPGFNDSHMHLLGYGNALMSADLASHTGSLAELLRYMKEYASAHPKKRGQWLLGRGWNQDCFSDETRMPDRHDLDSVSETVPILLTRACGHAAVANSPALRLAGIDFNTPDPEGGRIGREGNEPDGRLYDNAIDLLKRVVPLPDKEEVKDMIRAAVKALNSYGITSVQTDDYCVFRDLSYKTVNEAYRELEEAGELTVRVYEQSNFDDLGELSRFVSDGCVTGAGTDLFRFGPLKLLGDGSLGSRTAYLSQPYADEPDTRGLLIFSKEKLESLIVYAHTHGMQIAVHTIGDACLDQVLDAFEQALRQYPRTDHRHGIVHCQITREDQLKRIKDLGLYVYCQSAFLDYDNHIVEKRVGKSLASTSYAWKTLMGLGVFVSNGSDCPVEIPDVLRGIELAVTRTSFDGTGPYRKEEAFTVKEALDSFTIRSAEASFEEQKKGRIAPGYLADFTVLSKDPFKTPPKELHLTRAEETYLSGKKVFPGNT